MTPKSTMTKAAPSGTLRLSSSLLIAGLALTIAMGILPWAVPAALADTPGTWTNTGSLATARYRPPVTLLPNGKVLVAGGSIDGGTTALAELYDPQTGLWSSTGSLALSRHQQTISLLPNGKVLVAGGGTPIGFTATAELYDPQTGLWSVTGSMETAREVHTAALLPNGKVLVAGGQNSGGRLTSAELYDPESGTWTATGSLATARAGHTATLLPNGKVLVAGGLGPGDVLVGTAELYDPQAGTWSATGSLTTGRFFHTATLLPNGKVLVAGGNGPGVLVGTAELYDPQTGVWSATGSMGTARESHTATLLPNGEVLVAAGGGASGVLASGELYDPQAGTWAATGSLSISRTYTTSVLLPNGKVLIVGGYSGTTSVASAELYCPEMPGTPETFSATGSMGTVRFGHTATRLPNGKLLVAGGSSNGGITGLASADVYDPQTGNWSSTGAMATARYHHTATRLPNGKVLVTGGWNGFNVAAAELYDPQTGTWSSTGTMGQARHEHRAVLLPNGKVLVTGGSLGAGVPTSSVELYDPQTGTWSGTGSMAQARYGHSAVLLPTGKVLAATGWGGAGPGNLTSAELYDPQTGTWSSTGSLPAGAGRNEHATILLPNGKVLVAGGSVSGGTTASAALYDPQTGTWSSTGSMAQARSNIQYGVVLLPNGKVLVAGGDASVFPALGELYDFSAGTWVNTGPITSATARGNLTATLLANGQVLAAGGWNPVVSGIILASAELFSSAICEPEVAPKLTVIKHVINDDGGTATASAFTMTVTGTSPSPASFPGAEAPGTMVALNAGTYSVGETGPSGYTLSLSTDCTGSIGIGQTKTCTVTNNDNNRVPVVGALTLSANSIQENGTTNLSGTFTDPGSDSHTVTITWGDGTANTTLSLGPGVTALGPVLHQYLDDNPTATPSDNYPISVTVDDGRGGIGTGSTSVTVNNVAPAITGVTGPVNPIALGGAASVTVAFTDVGSQDGHTCKFSWDDLSADTIVTAFGTGNGSCTASHTYAAAGVYTVGVMVTDDDTGSASSKFEFVVIYDATGGFVTGGGWINSPAGAYVPQPSLTGKANFGFVSKYQKGATVPTGQTEFQFHVASFNFHSTSYDWLVTSGAKAQYKGSGTVNGAGNYGFLLTATDGALPGGGGVDKFRIKIVDKGTGQLVYDNASSPSDDIDQSNQQAIAGGSIVIHK